MVIGTAAAILGSAAIGAGASALSSSKSSKAAAKATDAQVQSNRESLAQQRDIYEINKGILSPYVAQGTMATGALNGLLGLGGDPTASRAAFDTYRGSTGYDFRVSEGQKALNTGYAGRGVLNSGAAQKAALSYGQNIASDEFGRYVGALQGQQQIGVGAGSALAGVGTTFANNATNINSNTGAAIGNGVLANASINNGFLNSISGIVGQTAGALSSYAPAGYNSYGIRTSDGIY